MLKKKEREKETIKKTLWLCPGKALYSAFRDQGRGGWADPGEREDSERKPDEAKGQWGLFPAILDPPSHGVHKCRSPWMTQSCTATELQMRWPQFLHCRHFLDHPVCTGSATLTPSSVQPFCHVTDTPRTPPKPSTLWQPQAPAPG